MGMNFLIINYFPDKYLWKEYDLSAMICNWSSEKASLYSDKKFFLCPKRLLVYSI